MAFEINAVNSVGTRKKSGSSAPMRSAEYTVRPGQNLTQIAREFGMTAREFKAWTGLDKDALSVGQKIPLPTVKARQGQGLSAIARGAGMEMKAFCQLNGIDYNNWRNYKVSKDEVFYVNSGGSSSASGASGASAASGSSRPSRSSGASLPAGIAAPSTSFPVRATGSMKVGNETYGTVTVPDCGYFVGDSRNPNVSRTSSSKPPIPVNKDGEVVAEVVKFAPSNTKSPQDLSGKTIMINAGHGWGAWENGKPKFDPGTNGDDSKGKNLEEWYKNRNLADDVIKELTARGATVIYTTGTAIMACDAKEKFSADLLISLHCDYAENNSSANGLKMIYHNGNSRSKAFAQEVDSKLSTQYNSNCKTISDTESGRPRLGLIDEGNRRAIPAVICEMGFMSNATDLLNIDSGGMQAKAAVALGDACIAYLGR